MNHYFTDNRQLAQNRKELPFRFSCFTFSFTSDNGVFSKSEVDYGSYAFLKTLEHAELGNKILDVGCGYGVLGIIIKKLKPASQLTMVDINPRAIELAKINAINNEVEVNIKESDCYKEINDHDYTDIITNPPIRAGKEIIYRIFEEAYEHLMPGGNLWVVIRKQHGALSAQKRIGIVFGNCEIINKEKGYFILNARK